MKNQNAQDEQFKAQNKWYEHAEQQQYETDRQ